MEFKNAADLPSCGAMKTGDTVMVLQDGKLRMMPLSDILAYLGSATVETDKTLKNEGMAAEAAAVRDFVEGKLVPVTITLTAGEAAWSDNKQTVTCTGMTADAAATSAIVAPAPDEDNYTAFNDCGVRCTAQGAGTLTFSCTSVPVTNLTVNVLVKK